MRTTSVRPTNAMHYSARNDVRVFQDNVVRQVTSVVAKTAEKVSEKRGNMR